MRKSIQGFTPILLILIVGLGILFFAIFNRSDKKEVILPVLEGVNKAITLSSPTPTPFAFQELTIPYLRKRSYLSNLEEMRKGNETLIYTSYVTSYDSDGLTVYGLLTIPKESPSTNAQGDSRRYPAIIFVHGYIPPQNYQTTVNYNSYVDYLAKNGFVVFKIDLRGHGNSEGEPGGGYYSSDYVIDTLNAIAALRNTDFVNPRAIGLWGHSMAGNVVFRALGANPEIPAVVIWAGAGYTYQDLQEYRIEDTSYQPPPPDSERAKKRQQLRDAYGTFNPDHWFWKQVPATNYLSDIKGAVQLNHAVNDNVVSIEYSKNLDSLLDKTSIPHELNEYSSGGHNLTVSAFSQAMQNTVEFFQKYL